MAGGSRGWSVALLCGCVAAALTGVGCGDDESTAGSKPISYSMASEPAQAFAERLAKLLETTVKKADCPQLDAINGRSLTRFSCPPSKGLRKSMARFEVVGGKEYGPGAVVDYTSGKIDDGAAIVLYAAPDRNWGVSRFGVVTKPSTRTSDAQSRAGFRRTVDAYLAAIHDRDCKAFVAVAFTDNKSRASACKQIFPATIPLSKRLKDNPAAKPKYEGGNATYGFFSLETRKPVPANLTISVVADEGSPNAPYLVLDTAPSPTTEEHRETIEALKQSQREKKRGAETSPSRKAD